MLIVCSRCTTGYDVRPQALGAAGRKVRCTRCGAEWIALPSAIPLPPGRIEARPEAPVPVPGTQVRDADETVRPETGGPPAEGSEAGVAAVIAEAGDNRRASEAASSVLPALSSPPISPSPYAKDGEKKHDIEFGGGKADAPKFAADQPPADPAYTDAHHGGIIGSARAYRVAHRGRSHRTGNGCHISYARIARKSA